MTHGRNNRPFGRGKSFQRLDRSQIRVLIYGRNDGDFRVIILRREKGQGD
jgi:hypothetical protein